VSGASASDLYEYLEPTLNAREIELPDLPALIEQAVCLVGRGGKIAHEPGVVAWHALIVLLAALPAPKPSLRARAVALARERGVVRTRDLADIGVPRCYLNRMCQEGLLVRVGYGRYRAADRKAA